MQYTSPPQLFDSLCRPNQAMEHLCEASHPSRPLTSPRRSFHWHKRYFRFQQIHISPQQRQGFRIILQRNPHHWVRGSWGCVRGRVSQLSLHDFAATRTNSTVPPSDYSFALTSPAWKHQKRNPTPEQHHGTHIQLSYYIWGNKLLFFSSRNQKHGVWHLRFSL